jgi:hypothetical protein
MQEAIPTRPPAKPPHEPWTPEEQAQHRADLDAALKGWHWQDDTRISRRRRRLHLVRDSDAPAA